MIACLHTLFEKHANRTPDLVAAKFFSDEISYRELNQKSNRLANYLCQKGVKTGDRVSLCVERSLNMLVCILGILKSGAAYVPIHPNDPEKRIKFLLEDMDSTILITQKKLLKNITCRQKIICLDRDFDPSSSCFTDNPSIRIPGDSLAVILYTSGSTGQPKGVMLSHHSLTNRIVWDCSTYQHSCNDIFLQHASYTFDFSVLEIFSALASGGKLILAKPDFYYDSNYLIKLIQNEKITKMGSGPSLLKAYIDLPEFKKCCSLKLVTLGGEPLSYDLQQTFFKNSSARLINIYGPTETSISVLHWNCDRRDKSKIVPIGHPVADMKIYLLNEKLQPVPDGEIGEIFISGPGVATGYHNRPALTKAHFIKNPFGTGIYGRLYKTGDLGKIIPNGAFLFMGRKDQQVKIRGFRIELQEIEHCINQMTDIRSCTVLGINDDNLGTKLIAYLVPITGSKISITTIKQHLQANLPEYMVPSLFITLDRLPLSPNGKVDRKALPLPDNARLLSQAVYAPPVTPDQFHLVRIWEKVLKVKPIGIDDAFYHLGGTSLLAAETFHLMQTEMGCTLPPSSFIKAITIRKQSQLIAESKSSSGLIHICRMGERTPVVFIRHVQGDPTLSSYVMDRIAPDIPFVITLPFGQTPETVPESIEEAAEQYLQELLKKFPRREYHFCGYSMGGLIALEMARQLKAKGKNIGTVFLIDTFHPEILVRQRDSYQTFKRIIFYLKNLIVSSHGVRIEIIKVLTDNAVSAVRSLIMGEATHPLFLNILQSLGTAPDRHRQFPPDKNILLALKYRPTPYSGNILLITAEGKKQPCIYQDKSYQDDKKENLRLWRETVSKKIHSIEIPGDHQTMIQETGIAALTEAIHSQIKPAQL